MNTTLIGVLLGMIALLFMVLRTRIHVFPAMVIATLIMGLFAGMAPADLTKTLTTGFGNTLSSIGLIIGFGVMMGACFEISGAAKRMAKTFIRIFGKGREDIALGVTGLVVSIPVFCDSAYILLQSLVRAISRNTGKSAVGLGAALAIGLLITHAMVPPTPGPVGVAGILNVDIGSFMLWGIVISIPMLLVTLLYTRRVGEQFFRMPAADGSWILSRAGIDSAEQINDMDDKDLPGNLLAFSPIVLPIILILIRTLFPNVPGLAGDVIQLVGHPVIAVGIGVLIAVYGLTGKLSREEIFTAMDRGVSETGIILLVTGAGGAMGAILKASGAGDAIASSVVASGLPGIMIPLFISALLRAVQGSATVSMITTASITAPLIAGLQLDPLFVALACAVGTVGFSHFNDSYFHVVTRTLGISDTRSQLRIWSVTATIAGGTGATMVVLLNLLFGSGGTAFDPVVPVILTLVLLALGRKREDITLQGVTSKQGA
ncbi:gluconate permease [Pokkaliibacter plantistimulans]|uniref:Gluconate permease n=1 Tax=Proteobacteria bacterium 228 TaxID=2083153 RepID=A0A2S5KRL3_9PROT|nr:SLC13 family permease [Pokkaliibacter plantistimulans]PPC77305.1 gluconate permease [Pokkaliibacter plantistimulans]